MIKYNQSKSVILNTIIISTLSFLTSIYSIIEENVYRELLDANKISENIFFGSIAQDYMTIIISIATIILVLLFKKSYNYKIFLLIIGNLGYFLYAYGLYTIQGMYTSVYLIYLLIFSLSIYSIIFGFISIDCENLNSLKLKKSVEISIIIFLLLILMFLVPAWIGGILQSVKTHTSSDTYGVYILDLCIVFPAFALTIINLIRKIPFAKLLAGIMLTKGFTICLAWSFAEWFVAYYRKIPVNIPMAAISTVLMITSFVLLLLYLVNLEK